MIVIFYYFALVFSTPDGTETISEHRLMVSCRDALLKKKDKQYNCELRSTTSAEYFYWVNE